MAFGYENVRPPPGELDIGRSTRLKSKSLRAVARAAVVGLDPGMPFLKETPFPPAVPRFEGGRLFAGTVAACPRLG